ncbi:MAG: ChaN family lipoprotein [Candidatus Latescibacterota bacterium]|nr:MAG: ChaN family lipoprotein [Candidatus Latescibacterota bacterium]
MGDRITRTAPGDPAGSRQAVLRLQRGVQRLLQAEVRAYTGGNTPALERYYREYIRDFRSQHSLTSFGELNQSILDVDLFFVGDYHTLRQSQELARRLLERAAHDERPLVLALEMVRREHQVHLDAYMRGEIREADFLQRVQYDLTWNFNWENYKPLFDSARRLGVRLVGINHAAAGQGMHARDEAIASSLVEDTLKWPAARFMVLIGDLHLASNHLPRALDLRLQAVGLQRRKLVVYQNSDTLYWTLAERGEDADAHVVRLGVDRFCVMEVPPHVKLQSYLSWEQAVERLHVDGEADELLVEASYTSVFEALVRQMGRFLELPPVEAGCEVFTNLDEHFFEVVENSTAIDEKRVREVHLLAFANRSCYVPEVNVVYLPFFSVNHACEEALHVLQVRHAGSVSAYEDEVEEFYARAWNAALGFCISKLVNPRRVATRADEFRSFLRSASRRLHEPGLAFRKLVARFVVQHKAHERARLAGRRGRLKQIYEQDLDVVLEVTHALGYMLGERLVAAVDAGRIDAALLRDLVLLDPSVAPSERYYATLRQLEA